MIEKTLLEHLLMKSRTVEARRERQLYIVYKRVIVGRRIYSVRIEALVEYKPLKNGFTVYEEFISVKPHAAKPKIA